MLHDESVQKRCELKYARGGHFSDESLTSAPSITFDKFAGCSATNRSSIDLRGGYVTRSFGRTCNTIAIRRRFKR